jgi:soluble lytic murein transglycosylase-like protein
MSETGIRQGRDRRQHDRRAASRQGRERRKGERRAAAGGLLLTGLTLAGAIAGRGAAPTVSAPAQAAESTTRPAPPAPPRPQPPSTPFDDIIREAAATYGVDVDLVRAVIQTESRFDPKAVSGAGAKGLMQIMPILAKELRIKNVFDPRENIFGGTKYLSQLLDRHDGNVTLALASYNAGPRNVARYRGVPPFKETRGYVRKIQKLVADGLPTPDIDTTLAD